MRDDCKNHELYSHEQLGSRTLKTNSKENVSLDGAYFTTGLITRSHFKSLFDR